MTRHAALRSRDGRRRPPRKQKTVVLCGLARLASGSGKHVMAGISRLGISRAKRACTSGDLEIGVQGDLIALLLCSLLAELGLESSRRLSPRQVCLLFELLQESVSLQDHASKVWRPCTYLIHLVPIFWLRWPILLGLRAGKIAPDEHEPYFFVIANEMGRCDLEILLRDLSARLQSMQTRALCEEWHTNCSGLPRRSKMGLIR